MGKKLRPDKEIELKPDAWPRFERFIRDIAKAGPQHRTAKPKSKARKPKSQITKEVSKI
ncbi:MAG: hypothetical protein ABSC37_22005 [Xanthobacteraceae bacterium]|jgi:hypothetical protein